MKKIKFIASFLLLLTGLIFTSCDTEPVDPALLPTNPQNPTGIFTAKIGNDIFNATQLIDAEYKDTPLGKQLTIVGITAGGRSMSITIMNPAIGTRTASSTPAILLSFDYSASANDLYSSYNATTELYSGTLTLSQFNLTTKKISGTFSYTGYGALSSATQVQITEGNLTNIAFDDLTAGGTDPNPNPTLTPVFKADFNGATWNATTYAAQVSPNFIQVAGLKSNGESFLFLVNSTGGVGTYPANDNIITYTPAGSEYGYWSSNIDDPEENTGSITITNINTVNKTISGTFNFKGYWSDSDVTTIPPVQFTNGVFTNIPYTDQVDSGDTFFAKVNGIEFVDVDLLVLELGIDGQDYYSIGVQNAALNSMTVSVRTNIGVGTYPMTGNSAVDVVQVIYNLNDVDYRAVSGTVKITEKTATRLKGTFSGVTNGATPFTITEGAFDVEY